MSATKKSAKKSNKNVKDLQYFIDKVNQAIKDGDLVRRSNGHLRPVDRDEITEPIYNEAMEELDEDKWDEFTDYYHGGFTKEEFLKIKNS